MACCVAANPPTMCPLRLVFVVGGWCWTLKDTAVRPHCLALCCGVWGSEAAAAAADGGTLLAWLCRLKSRYNTLEFICAFYFWSIIIFHFKWLQTMTLHKDTTNSQHQHQMKDTTGSGGGGYWEWAMMELGLRWLFGLCVLHKQRILPSPTLFLPFATSAPLQREDVMYDCWFPATHSYAHWAALPYVSVLPFKMGNHKLHWIKSFPQIHFAENQNWS